MTPTIIHAWLPRLLLLVFVVVLPLAGCLQAMDDAEPAADAAPDGRSAAAAPEPEPPSAPTAAIDESAAAGEVPVARVMLPSVQVNASFAVLTWNTSFEGRVEVQAVDGGVVGGWNVSTDIDRLLVPFLRPATTYRLTVVLDSSPDLESSFRTLDSEGAPVWEADKKMTRPGYRIETGDSGCSFGFLLRDATNETWYGLTAGHCAPDDPAAPLDVWVDRYLPPLLGPVGEFVAWDKAPSNQTGGDWALFRIHDDQRFRIDPSMAWWGLPERAAGDAVVAKTGDRICIEGEGVVYQYPNTADRITHVPLVNWRSRCGQLGDIISQETPDVVRYTLQTWQGDSGAPVTHWETGLPLAMNVAGWSGATGTGPTFCYLVDQLRERGYDLRPMTGTFHHVDPGFPIEPRTTDVGDHSYDLTCEWVEQKWGEPVWLY